MAGGRIYIAFAEEAPAACLAFHAMKEKSACELKRFYTKPEFRGRHIGSALLQMALSDAKHMGYRFVYLDTLTSLAACNHLYRKFGFQKIPPYYQNPLPNVCYYRLDFEECKR